MSAQPNLNLGKRKMGHYTERRLISHDKALVCVKITTPDDVRGFQ